MAIVLSHRPPFVAASRNLLLLTALVLTAGCGAPAAIGGPCEISAQGDNSQSTTLTTVALECQGHTCIKHQQGPALCSAACTSEEDCTRVDPAGASLCRKGFTCVAPLAVGDYACQRF